MSISKLSSIGFVLVVIGRTRVDHIVTLFQYIHYFYQKRRIDGEIFKMLFVVMHDMFD